jgi:hypothetical protein
MMGLLLVLDIVVKGGLDADLTCLLGFHWRIGCSWLPPANGSEANFEPNHQRVVEARTRMSRFKIGRPWQQVVDESDGRVLNRK